MNEFEKNGFATFIDNGDGWERIPNAKFMMKDENGTEIEMTPNEVIKQLMQDNKSLEHCINNLQSKIDKAIEICDYSFKNSWYVSEKELLGKIIGILKEDK